MSASHVRASRPATSPASAVAKVHATPVVPAERVFGGARDQTERESTQRSRPHGVPGDDEQHERRRPAA